MNHCPLISHLTVYRHQSCVCPIIYPSPRGTRPPFPCGTSLWLLHYVDPRVPNLSALQPRAILRLQVLYWQQTATILLFAMRSTPNIELHREQSGVMFACDDVCLSRRDRCTWDFLLFLSHHSLNCILVGVL